MLHFLLFLVCALSSGKSKLYSHASLKNDRFPETEISEKIIKTNQRNLNTSKINSDSHLSLKKGRLSSLKNTNSHMSRIKIKSHVQVSLTTDSSAEIETSLELNKKISGVKSEINILTNSKNSSTIPNVTSQIIKLKNDHNSRINQSITLEIMGSKNNTLSHKHLSGLNKTEQAHILYRIHATITRSKDAIWASITLTFMCVILVLAVAQSQMWKDYRGSESQGVPMPNFNERVLFKDVMNRRMASLKEIFKKKKSVSELESLLPTTEWDDE